MLGSVEARLVATVLDQAECRGADEIRRVAIAARRLRWITGDRKGQDPGGEDVLLDVAHEILGDILSGKITIRGSWAEATMVLAEKLRPPVPKPAPDSEEPEGQAPEDEEPESEEPRQPEEPMAEQEAAEAA